ncbi:MAG: aminoacyl-tRNA hydrolase [Phycisphaerales bacterium]|jgi:PTH1 family peptidyl-tRNA hydrolase|nr:aminoacyl-tRNA hydrolase [Phycisphaerales bacterium]
MKLIVGLGNPGSKHDKTRHNVGFNVVDRLARQLSPGEPAISKFDAVVIENSRNNEKLLLMKPQKYMNRSGSPIKQAITFYKANPKCDLLVIVDDIHLPCGTIRIRNSGSPGGHNGLTDITNHIGDEHWSRLRIGVDEPGLITQSDYVLGKFTPEQKEQVEPALENASCAAIKWLDFGIDEAMNQFNEIGKSETTRN